MAADATGHWWAGHRGGSDFREQPTSYYDPDGRLLGHVSFPPLRILRIGDDFIAALSRDPVKRYPDTLIFAQVSHATSSMSKPSWSCG